MTDLKTDPSLLDALRKAAKAGVPREQLRAQKVSFILGALGDNSNVTKERVEEVLDKLDGQAA